MLKRIAGMLVAGMIVAGASVGLRLGIPRAEDAAPRDHFTEALEAGEVLYFSPHGGENMIFSQDGPFRIDYWNIPKVVRPGQLVRCSLGYTFTARNSVNSILYMTILADWAPDTPVVFLVDGEKQGEPRSVRKEFAFRAPEAAGSYRLRLAIAWAFKGVQSFWGDGPRGDVYDPGVCHYSEVAFDVAHP
jgi:hypothetical protein